MVGERCGLPVVERRGSLARIQREHGVDWIYVVARDRESVTDGNARLHVDAGLLHAKRASGRAHPLITALLGPDHRGAQLTRVFDGTLGLAGDALHLAAVLACEVVAAEASPVVFSLAEAALADPDPSFADAAQHIRPVLGLAEHVLKAEGPFDAVFLAPMFETPALAAPGYPVFRRLADHRPLDAATLDAARAAAPRVVVRWEKGGAPPEPSGWEAVPSKAVDYWVWAR